MKREDMQGNIQGSMQENVQENMQGNIQGYMQENIQDSSQDSSQKNDRNDAGLPQGKRLTGSTFAKIVAFFLMTISFVIGAVAVIATIYMVQAGLYDYGDSIKGHEELAYNFMHDAGVADAAGFYYIKWPDDQQELEELLDGYCEEKNIRMEVWKIRYGLDQEAHCILSNYEGYDTPYVYQRGFREYETIEENADVIDTPAEPEEGAEPDTNAESSENEKAADESRETDESVDSTSAVVAVPAGGEWKDTAEDTAQMLQQELEVYYTVKVYVNPELPIYDEYAVAFEQAKTVWQYRNVFPAVALGCIFVCIICFIFLMCSAGHKNGRSGITPSVLTGIHFDVLTAVFGYVAIMGLAFGLDFAYNFGDRLALILLIVILTAEVIWCTIYCMEAALQFKMGQWWKHTLFFVVLSLIGKGIRFLCKGMVSLIKGLPLIVNTVIIFAGVCIVEAMLFLIWGIEDGFTIWLLEKMLLFPVILYIALVCKKLQEGSRALAEGDLNYKLDTSRMLLDFKEHGENLNQIGEGISRAVEERMKSEHMKTELITNVSHDIKTPLTSIINYADLLGNAAGNEEQLNREKVAEYSEVLVRQSKRLKKLLEDLVEASKATTGNLEVNMEKCEVGVLLSQAVGEYEQRFWEKQLELITRQPEEPVWVMADGRRLWRVFDNLLNNICKYAQEHTRVYVTVEKKDPSVEIIFRNMSKYPLELTGEELEERFVRGDKSRHMEGNGLGLSIAKSLVELQNGKLEIVTDGDLFKVILTFPVVK